MPKSLNIISANDLRSGLNVYFIQDDDNNRWATDIDEATLYDEGEVTAALLRAKQDMDKNIVVDCFIVPVDEAKNPLTTREKIRAEGPSSNYGHFPSQ